MRMISRINKSIVFIIAPLIFIIFIYNFILPVSANSSKIQNAKNGVVCVVTSDKASKTVGWGTGFAIGKPNEKVQYIVTNYHVVEDAVTNDYDIKVYYSDQSEKYIKASVVVKSTEKDLAILKLSAPLSDIQPLNLLESDKVNDSETVYTLGYPGVALEGSDNKSFNRTDITITSGIISNRIIQLGEKCFQIDAQITSGDSGGPLLNENGDVVGINTRSLKDNSSINYSIVSDELIQILNQNNIPFDQAGNNETNKIIIVGATFILVILIAVIITMRLKKKKRSINQTGKEMKPSPLRVPIQTNSTTTQDVTSAVIYGLTGKHANGRLGVRSGHLVFGRDASFCDVLYPPEDNEISDKHCEISYDADIKGYTIKDLSSIGGTFLGEGSKLEPNQSIKIQDGDVFYLTSKKNMFKIRIE
jgi:S1-C subfamily serine protease